MLYNDTIAAIATGMTSSGIGIIRISGSDAFAVAEKIFRPHKKNKRLSEQETYTIHYGTIMDGKETLDEVIVLLMKGPHSYTAEDTVEIDCHGGVFVMKKILELVLRNGARVAEPGEFTKRAFLNGRIDLSGRSSHGCDRIKKCICIEEFSKSVKWFCHEKDQGNKGKSPL